MMTPTNADLLRIGWKLSWAGYCKREVIWEWRGKLCLTRTKLLERWDSLVKDKLIFYRSKDYYRVLEGWRITPEGLRLLNGGDQQ